MAKNYAQMSGMETKYTKRVTKQTKKASPNQIKNNAGGYTFESNDWQKLNRFLVIGTEGGTYYVSEKKLSKDNVKTVSKLIKADGIGVVDRVVKVSKEGLAQKNDQALFVLAMCASSENEETRSYALRNLNAVARTGTHLFAFVTYVDQMRGWGKGLQKAISRWYNEKPANKLALQVCKYASRKVEGEKAWSHRDLLRKAHTIPVTKAHDAVFSYVTSGATNKNTPKYIIGHNKAKKEDANILNLIKEYNLVRESLPTEALNDPKIWNTMLDNGMPLTAMIRNLGNMSKHHVLKPLSKAEKIVVETLKNEEALRNARVHPFNVLAAYATYKNGAGYRGTGSWSVNQKVLDALDGAFYKSFKYVEPTGKNILIAIDASGSMGCQTSVPFISCRDAAAVMAMVVARTEENHHLTYFNSGSGGYWSRNDRNENFRYTGGIAAYPCSSNSDLQTVLNKTASLPWGGTDCSLPMLYAMNHSLDVDAFVILTDNETWAGRVQPHQALEEYRRRSGKHDAKLVTVGMVANNFTIADPNDPRQIDVCGFDSSTPQLISDFIAGKF